MGRDPGSEGAPKEGEEGEAAAAEGAAAGGGGGEGEPFGGSCIRGFMAPAGAPGAARPLGAAWRGGAPGPRRTHALTHTRGHPCSAPIHAPTPPQAPAPGSFWMRSSRSSRAASASRLT